MELKLWGNINKRKNSTKQPWGSYVSMEVVLKEGTSLEAPTFILQADESILDFNYCQFAGHYYFINDIVISRNNIFELVCQQDVLATYKSEIGKYECFVERSASKHNQYFIDSEVSALQRVIRKRVDSKTIKGLSTGTSSYVLRIVGSSGDGINTFVASNLNAYLSIFNQERYLTEGTEDVWAKITNVIFNPFDYVVSLSASPIGADFYPGTTSRIYAKWFDTQSSAKLVSTRLKSDSATLSVNNVYLDFRRYHPAYTQYDLYLPGIGTVNISPQDIVSDSIVINYNIDLYTGAIAYVIQDSGYTSNSGPFATFSGNIYSQIQIGSSAWDAKSITIGAASAVSSAVAGNYLGTATSLTNVASNVIMPTPSVHGSSSDNLILENFADIELTTTNFGSGDIANDDCGRPLFNNERLGSLSGYIKCGNASIPLAGLGNDAETINAYLNGGFYYE